MRTTNRRNPSFPADAITLDDMLNATGCDAAALYPSVAGDVLVPGRLLFLRSAVTQSTVRVTGQSIGPSQHCSIDALGAGGPDSQFIAEWSAAGPHVRLMLMQSPGVYLSVQMDSVMTCNGPSSDCMWYALRHSNSLTMIAGDFTVISRDSRTISLRHAHGGGMVSILPSGHAVVSGAGTRDACLLRVEYPSWPYPN